MEQVTQAANTIHMMYLCEALGRSAAAEGFKGVEQYAIEQYIYYKTIEDSKKAPWDRN